MRNRQEIFLKAFLVATAPEKREALARFLPDARRETLSEYPDIPLENEETIQSPFDHIHWSWFTEVLQSYPEKEQRLFLRALNPRIQKPLTKALDISPSTDLISPMGANFLRKILLESVQQDDILPIQYLPYSPLNLLLQIEKKKLLQLINFLSLYDLSCEIRQIVETKTLNKIYSSLSDEERQFLKIARENKQPYPPVKVHLEKWDGTKEKLRKMLHKIGLSRLGSALAGQHPDLIWYVCHQLDSGRGKVLKKLSQGKEILAVATWLSEQLKELT